MTDLTVGGDGQIGAGLTKHWHEIRRDFHSSTRNINIKDKNTPYIDLSTQTHFDIPDKSFKGPF